MRFHPRLITVEPVMFFSQMASFIQYPSIQALYYTKVCQNMYNHTVCTNIHNESFKTEEHEVESQTSTWILYHNLTFSIPAIAVAVFMGSWSDRISRRLPIVISVIGGILSNIVLILNSVYLEWPIGLCLLSSVVGSMFGGFVLLLSSLFSYIGHVSSEKSRTAQIAVLEAMLFLGGTFGSVFGGLMVDRQGFTFTFSFNLAVYVLILVFLLTWVLDIRTDGDMDSGWKKKYFNYHYFIDSCLVMFKWRPGNGKLRIVCLVLSLGALFLSTDGANDITFLFLRHPPLSWSQTLYGVYSGLSLGFKGLLLISLVPLFRWMWKVHDTTFILIGLLSKSCGLILLSVSQTTWMGMLAPVIGMLQGWPSACIRSMISSHVSKGEQGKIFAIVSCLEAALTLGSSAIFNSLYPLTLDVFAGLMLVIAAVLLLIPAGLVFYVRVDLKNESESDDHLAVMDPDSAVNED